MGPTDKRSVKFSKHINLNDRTLKALKGAPEGKTFDYWDKSFPGFAVRVSETGRKTFVLAARYPGSTAPARRKVGVYGPITLADARQKARDWLKLIEKGIDPQLEEDKQRLREQTRRKNTFAAVAEDFIAEKLPHERSGSDAERDLRNVFIPVWGNRPITEITDLDALGVIKAKAKDAPVYARNLLALLKRFFVWAIDQRVYELQWSPCERIKPRSIFGERIPRQRKLSDAELFAFWRAVSRMPYPYGPLYRLLLLTGLRRNEVAWAKWSEFDPAVVRELRKEKDKRDWKAISKDKLRWTIPAERMKAKNNRARDHAVPLSAAAVAVLEELPKTDGDYVFSTNGGKKPVWIGDKIKKDLDREMLLTLQALAKGEGENPRKVKLENWTNHDLRRNVRSGMSQLRIPDAVAEAVLAHTQGIIAKTYNVDDLFDQKADALGLWADHIKALTSLRSKGVSVRVVPLKDEADKRRASFAERAAWLARA
jgi:integrase